MKKIIMIKLGGSLITKKEIPFCVNEEVINEIVKEIKGLYDSGNRAFIIGHGGGSFPHVYAKEYKINEGFVIKNSHFGFCKVQNAAATLNRIVVEKFIAAGLSVSTYQISNSCIQKNGIIESADLNSIYMMLDYGITPIVYGDVSFDGEKGCSVISTEEIFRYIAEDINLSSDKYSVEQVILCGSVDGVLTADPNCKKNAELIPIINNNNYNEIKKYLGEAYGFDVTGGMMHKVSKMMNIKNGVSTRIINGKYYGNLSRVVLGQNVGTLIET